MFRAVVDQLDKLGANAEKYNHSSLRALSVQYMKKNVDMFVHFLSEEEESFDAYCTKMATTAAWGGQLELQAIVQVVQAEVWVFSMSSPTLKMGTE
jgi:OTU domain-containing protein 6